MTKITYTATDANGAVHTRKTERVYTHTVVAKASLEFDLAQAKLSEWAKQERRNWEYERTIAEGNDPYPRQNFMRDYPDRWSAEQIAANQITIDAENAKRLADAQAFMAEHPTADAYIAAMRAKRIAAVEKRAAEGYYEQWGNMGWCGRHDLALKLAAKLTNPRHAAVAIIEATEKGAR